jgi:type I restriction enzyme R subunit
LDRPGATYFITACLDGSIPAEGLLDVTRYRTSLAQRRKPEDLSDDKWRSLCWKWMFARQDQWLDQSLAVRSLADPIAARILVDSFYYYAGERYDLLAYVVMPSHFHWVFTPRADWEVTLSDERPARERIMHGLKLHTAFECNRHFSERGTFWQSESYDHCVKDEDELERIIHYIELNPVKARLAKSREEWEFSSARDRAKWGIAFGQPLLRPRI